MNENPCLIKLGQKKLQFQTGFTLSLPDPAGAFLWENMDLKKVMGRVRYKSIT